jgi:hypothetical protein
MKASRLSDARQQSYRVAYATPATLWSAGRRARDLAARERKGY